MYTFEKKLLSVRFSFFLLMLLYLNCTTQKEVVPLPNIPENPTLARKIQAVQKSRKSISKELWLEKTDEDLVQGKGKISLKEVGVATLVIGDVTATLSKSRTRTIKRGARFVEGENIQTGKRSRCDLVLTLPDRPAAVIRINENTSFKVSQTHSPDVSPVFGKGGIFVEVPKNQDGYQIQTVTWVTAVRGTRFEIRSENDFDSIKVVEGLVSASANLPEKDAVKNKEAIETVLLSEEVELPKGKAVELPIKENQEFLKKSGLETVLKDVGKSKFQEKINSLARDPIFKNEHKKYIDLSRNRVKDIPPQEVIRINKEIDQITNIRQIKVDALSKMFSLNDKQALYTMNMNELDDALSKSKSPCPNTSLPGVFVGDNCSEVYTEMKALDRDGEDLYKYYSIGSENRVERFGTLNYFIKNCDTKINAVKEKITKRINSPIDQEEKQLAQRALERLNSCQ